MRDKVLPQGHARYSAVSLDMHGDRSALCQQGLACHLTGKKAGKISLTNEPTLCVAQARRAAALQALERALQAEPGAGAAAEQVVELWTKALPLLGDKAAAVRQAVLPVIGLLGAVATRPGVHTGALRSTLGGSACKSADSPVSMVA